MTHLLLFVLIGLLVGVLAYAIGTLEKQRAVIERQDQLIRAMRASHDELQDAVLILCASPAPTVVVARGRSQHVH